MKIVQLDIEGFRSLKNVSWKPGNLNVIIGPNGSGKSNLLRMLQMISASAQGRLSNFIQSAGGMGRLLWDGQASSIQWHLQTAPELPYPAYRLAYIVKLMREGQTGSYQVVDEVLERHDLEATSKMAPSEEQLVRHGTAASVYGDDRSRQDIKMDAGQDAETLLHLSATPFAHNDWIPFFQGDLTAWTMYEELHTDAEAAIRQAPVTRFEMYVKEDGRNIINVLHTLYTGSRGFEKQVDSAMRATFGDVFEKLIFQPASDQRVQLRVRWKTLRQDTSAADLSDGTLRFLFLMATLATPEPPPLIAIDEPETGLHPSMLPIVAELAVSAAERTQVVFTTHSDQFLDAFRETGVTPTTTVARWENGETTLTTLSEEDLAYWLKNYSLGKMFRTGELENLAA